MATWIDKKYLNLISPQLPRFKWKSENIANHRCVFCGDSQKKKFKARGYHFEKNGGLFYKCHNCGIGMSMANFIKRLDDNLYKQYVMERYKNGENKYSNYKKPKPEKGSKPEFQKKAKSILSQILPSIDELEDTHPAVEYLTDRKIPEKFFSEMYFIDDFKKIEQLSKTAKKAGDNEQRILIPFYNRRGLLTGFTARTIDPNNDLRYFTIRLSDDAPMIFNLDRVDFSKKIYVLEGPLDSMFIPNSVAAGGTNLKQMERFMPKAQCVLVYDYQPRNKDLLKIIKKSIDAGYQIAFLPNDFGGKDINDAILHGLKPQEIIDIIDKNTYKGLQAHVKFNSWKEIC